MPEREGDTEQPLESEDQHQRGWGGRGSRVTAEKNLMAATANITIGKCMWVQTGFQNESWPLA